MSTVRRRGNRVQNKFNKEVAQVLEPSAQDTTAAAVLARYSPGQIEQAKDRVEARELVLAGGDEVTPKLPTHIGGLHSGKDPGEPDTYLTVG